LHARELFQAGALRTGWDELGSKSLRGGMK
jgi:hypothetical protein